MKPILCLLTVLAVQGAPPRPRLVVVLSVDQGSAEMMDRYVQHLPGGLGNLLRNGTTFTRAYHAHGITETAPGHSVILSGALPYRTGIPQNEWLDRPTGKPITSVQDSQCLNHGASPGAPGSSAQNLKASTLGHWLQTHVPGSRSFSVTGKDRSAILMAGPRATGVYWFQAPIGFTTSNAYAPRLPSWVEAHNASLTGRIREGGLRWNPLGDGDQRTWSGPFQLGGRSMVSFLPRTILEVGGIQDEAFWTRYKASPFFDEAILAMAETLCREERLGQGKGKGIDLLAVGLSATDYVGHLYGTAGAEMEDQLRRLDARLRGFLEIVYRADPQAWLVVTADHGACDFPERLALQNYQAHRIPSGPWRAGVQRHLRENLGLDRDLLVMSCLPQVYLDDATAAASGRPRAELIEAAAAALMAAPGVAEVVTAAEMEATAPPPIDVPTALTFRERMRLSYVSGRSGDLQVILKPYTLLDEPDLVASHGSPYDYDRRVWMTFSGPWAAERRQEAVRVADLAPTLSKALGLPNRSSWDGRPLPLRVKKP